MGTACAKPQEDVMPQHKNGRSSAAIFASAKEEEYVAPILTDEDILAGVQDMI